MKKVYLFVALVSIATLQIQAQNELPKGYASGRIILTDSTIITGYIKQNIRSNASVTILTTVAAKKKSYDGSDLMAAEIDSSSWLCIKGDFFRVVCKGELLFLQKESDASHKPVYNGTEALFINGTEGKLNDYFFYDQNQKQLTLLTKNNMAGIISGSFKNCTAAITKARETGDDLAQLKQAVEIYNGRNGK